MATINHEVFRPSEVLNVPNEQVLSFAGNIADLNQPVGAATESLTCGLDS